MSPSFFQGESPPSKTCECILKGRYDNRIMAQYVHTDIYQASNQSCTESSVLFESKLSPNQTELDKTTEVCGRRSLNNYLYRGDLRITFKDVDSGSKSGFVSKLLGKYLLMFLDVILDTRFKISSKIFEIYDGIFTYSSIRRYRSAK